METISISKLKAHLSGELKKVQHGTKIIVLDHNHPVAELIPISKNKSLFVREATSAYQYRKLSPLVSGNLLEDIEEERSDRW